MKENKEIKENKKERPGSNSNFLPSDSQPLRGSHHFIQVTNKQYSGVNAKLTFVVPWQLPNEMKQPEPEKDSDPYR